MTELIILGSAASIPDEHHENTHMAIVASSGAILIDCSSTPAVRLTQAGIRLEEVEDLIVTHFHPDHVAGVPLLLMNMWLTGRHEALRIYGLHHCLMRLEDMMGFYHWENWPEFFSVAFHRLPERAGVKVLETDEVTIHSTPVVHLVPTVGLRIVSKSDGTVLAYSSDTEPSQAVVDLAQGAHILLHEASGEAVGHSSAQQAGEIAQRAGVEKLLLIHYPPGQGKQQMLREAKSVFTGQVDLATDFMRIPLGKG
jgi:ribonuclease Z